MIDDLVDIGRMEGGNMPLVLQESGIEALLVAARASVALEGRFVVWDMTGSPRKVTCDRALVHRVLVMLLGNAVTFTPRGDPIRISVDAVRNGIRFGVSDSGPGIPSEHRETIFDKFGRVGATRPEGVSSKGLGLAFCKLAVEAHEGQIGVESEVGEGSTFWFTLPDSPV